MEDSRMNTPPAMLSAVLMLQRLSEHAPHTCACKGLQQTANMRKHSALRAECAQKRSVLSVLKTAWAAVLLGCATCSPAMLCTALEALRTRSGSGKGSLGDAVL